MKSLRSLTLTLSLSLGLPAICSAEAKLKVGDKAPEIKTGEWVQGDPVKEFSKENVYVVEFWATWCGPCVATIPHLDKLHEELKDKNVVFIGQNCLEQEGTDKVKAFVKKMGEKMSYRVATDDTSSVEGGYMAVNWMDAADQKGIPCAFVVGKDGKIAWIGHPAQLKADLLKEVAAGTFDVKKAAEQQEKEAAAEAAAEEALMKVGEELNNAIEAEEWDKALGIVDKLEKEHPEMADQATGMRFGIGARSGKSELIVKSVEKMISGPMGDDPQMLNQIAWAIATELKEPAKEVLEVAAKAAGKAAEKSKDEPAVLDTVARIQFMQGKKEEAIKTQESAIAKAPDDLKAGMKKALESYKAGKLPDASELSPEEDGDAEEEKESK